MDVPVYIELPRGIDVFDPIAAELDRQKATRRRALRLVKALYGLRQSPRLFYKDLAKTLQDAMHVHWDAFYNTLYITWMKG